MNKICQIANESIESNIKIKLRVSKILQRYSKAASPLTNCGCQCSSLTFSDSAGVVQVIRFSLCFLAFVLLYSDLFRQATKLFFQGNCRTVDGSGARWCYVDAALGSSCQDLTPSAR